MLLLLLLLPATPTPNSPHHPYTIRVTPCQLSFSRGTGSEVEDGDFAPLKINTRGFGLLDVGWANEKDVYAVGAPAPPYPLHVTGHRHQIAPLWPPSTHRVVKGCTPFAILGWTVSPGTNHVLHPSPNPPPNKQGFI